MEESAGAVGANDGVDVAVVKDGVLAVWADGCCAQEIFMWKRRKPANRAIIGS